MNDIEQKGEQHHNRETGNNYDTCELCGAESYFKCHFTVDDRT